MTEPRSLLFVAPLLPAESGNGLAMRAGVFLDAFARDFAVTLLVVPVADGRGDGGHASRFVRRRTRRVVTLSLEGVLDPLWELSARILDGQARTDALAAYPRPALCRHATTPCLNAARTALEGTKFDVVHVMRSYLAPYAAPFLRGGDNPRPGFASIDLDDDEALTYRRLAALYRQAGRHDDSRLADAEAVKYERHEATWLPRFQLRIACTAAHARAVAAASAAGSTAVVPNTIALPWRLLQPAPRRASRNRILFVGNLSYFPNIEGIGQFARETLPLLRRRIGNGVQLRIAGSTPAPEIVALARSPARLPIAQLRIAHLPIELVADPPRLAAHYRWADLCVIPIVAGGGTRIKLLEAFAHGVPVVSTPLGAEGIAVRDRVHLLLAERDGGFADACAEALADRELAARLAGDARRLVETDYSREKGLRIIRETFAAHVPR